jgi:hypothetical protein
MKRTQLYIVVGVAIVAVLALAYAVIFQSGWFFRGVVADKGEGLSEYSAVFVNGGGIYFGKITAMTDEKITLEEVFNYGVVQDGEQKTTTENENVRPTLFDASRVGIAPAERYYINRDQVLIWYTLKEDSEVVDTIKEYQKNPNATPAPTASATATPRN